MNFPKCVKCGEPNTTEQFFGTCVVCYDCAEELSDVVTCGCEDFSERK